MESDARRMIQLSDSLSSRKKLAPKQAKVLEFIERTVSRSGCPPTFREIGGHFGLSVGTVSEHIRALVKKGFLIKEPGVACGLRLAYHAESVSVPILGAVPAGRPLEAIEGSFGSLPVLVKFKSRGDLYAIKVKGDSMAGAGILDGDFVVVRMQGSAENGDTVVAMIEGEVTLKTLRIDKRGTRLIAQNPKYPVITLDPSRQNSILGKVVAVHRYY